MGVAAAAPVAAAASLLLGVGVGGATGAGARKDYDDGIVRAPPSPSPARALPPDVRPPLNLVAWMLKGGLESRGGVCLGALAAAVGGWWC